MLRIFQNDLLNTDNFIITLELVPGKESIGRSVDTVMGIAKDSFSDGRISAVSITDNPGGNPSLSPDVIGYEIFKVGMDVIASIKSADGDGITISWQIEDVESTYLRFNEFGIKTSKLKNVWGARAFYIFDPEGHRLEFWS